MIATLIDAQPKRTSRPKPGPGHRVASSDPDAFAPWAAVLEHSFTTGRFEWVMSDEGALVPVPLADRAPSPGRSAVTGRVAALFRR